jgi:beta-phosphoglucomutase-like phosphatase (HAD superfamily)
MGDLRLVIFDCDGVLVDSEPISNGVLARMLTEQGLPMTVTEARREYQGLLLADVLINAEAKLGRPLPENWLVEFERDRAGAFRRELQAVPYVQEAIGRVLSSGLDICVASQGKLTKTRLSLELTGLRNLFSERAIFSAYSVPRGKPHPDLFLHAASAMGAALASCVVVEDTPSGVAAAMAAGMRALGYAADSDAAALQDAGAETFSSMRDLPALLGLD